MDKNKVLDTLKLCSEYKYGFLQLHMIYINGVRIMYSYYGISISWSTGAEKGIALMIRTGNAISGEEVAYIPFDDINTISCKQLQVEMR